MIQTQPTEDQLKKQKEIEDFNRNVEYQRVLKEAKRSDSSLQVFKKNIISDIMATYMSQSLLFKIASLYSALEADTKFSMTPFIRLRLESGKLWEKIPLFNTFNEMYEFSETKVNNFLKAEIQFITTGFDTNFVKYSVKESEDVFEKYKESFETVLNDAMCMIVFSSGAHYLKNSEYIRKHLVLPTTYEHLINGNLGNIKNVSIYSDWYFHPQAKIETKEKILVFPKKFSENFSIELSDTDFDITFVQTYLSSKDTTKSLFEIQIEDEN